MVFLVCNWKMAPEKDTQATDLAKKTLVLARTYKKSLSVVVCPPYIHIPTVGKVAKATIGLGAQNVSASVEIANTGDVSAAMLKSYKTSYCIVGHSEVRAKGETNKDIAEKVLQLLEKKITPIICVGERARDAQGWYLSEVKDQLETVLQAVPENALKKVLIAYEPVWAIGKNAVREATTHECQEMIIFIRKVIADHANEKISASIPVLYGGSVDEKNANSYVTEGGAQGFLVGRVSLDAKRLNALAKSVSEK